jgi:hypothetical protein
LLTLCICCLVRFIRFAQALRLPFRSCFHSLCSGSAFGFYMHPFCIRFHFASCVRLAVAFRSHGNCLASASQSHNDRVGVDLTSVFNRLVIALQSLRRCFVICFVVSSQSLCCIIAIALLYHCNRFAVSLQSLCAIIAIALRYNCNCFTGSLQSLCNRRAITS